MTMTTQLPVGLKRRVNLFVATENPEEEDVIYEDNNRHDFVIEPIPFTRSQTLEGSLNTREKIAFATFCIFVYFGQIFADLYFWNQTNNQLLLIWSVHRVALLGITLVILFQTKLTFTLIGPRKTMCTFDYLVEYEKVSAIVYHSFQAGQVFHNYFARGIFGAESIYHIVVYICVLAYMSKKYKIVF
jgi:hypothetical protein